MEYNSPTLGLYFMYPDYIEFLQHLEYYLKEAKIEFVEHSKYPLGDQRRAERSIAHHWYPIGLLGGKVEIHFLHYHTEEEAAAKWYRRAQRIVSVSSLEERKIVKICLKEKETGVSVGVEFFFIAPCRELMLKRTANESKFTINEMSIVYAINMNGRNFLFTGDFEGKNMKMMDTSHMELLKFLKIPHHASYRSNNIIGQLLSHNAVNLVQTVTQKGTTPNRDELNEYKKTGIVYVASDDTVKTQQYGYVLTRYGLREAELIETPLMMGNAHQHS